MPKEIVIGRNEADKKIFGKKGLIYLGKHYVKMGQITSLSNQVMMDVVRSHVILIAGKRGSGKSYTLGVIAEELSNLPKKISENISSLIFDTMGIYWTMQYRNEKEFKLLKEWELEAKKLPVKILVPFGKRGEYEKRKIPVEKTFALDVSDLEIEDWLTTFNLHYLDPVAILIENCINELKEKEIKYDIDDIIKEIKEKKEEKLERAAVSLFESAKTWGVFASKKQESLKVSEIIEGGKTTILDLSCYSSIGAFNVRALVIGLITKKLFNERMISRKAEEVQAVQHGIDYLAFKEKREMPLVWIMIDEAHEFLPKEGKTAATEALIQVLREGRQPGISLVLATQQPGQIHRDVMTQSDIVISHRVTASLDIEALNNIMQNYMLADIRTYLNNLPRLSGSAIILDDNSERIYPIRVRPRFTWHGGEAPTAIKIEKRF